MAENSKAADNTDTENPSLGDVLAGSRLLASGAETIVAEPVENHEEIFDEEHDEQEDLNGSLAAKVLKGLALLILGGVIALWGGPKIAPSLPSGLGGVKAWLMPGERGATAELAALRQEFEDRFAALPAAISESETAELVQNIVTEKIDLASIGPEVQEKLNALSDQIAAIESAGLAERLSGMETRLEGVLSQLDSLGTLAESADGLSEDAVAQIGKFAATVDGLRAEITGLASRDGALEKRIEAVAASAERRISESDAELERTKAAAAEESKRALAQNSLSRIANAVGDGTPYAPDLAQLQQAFDGQVPVALVDNADAGVATLTRLKLEFTDAAYQAIRSEIRTKSTGSALDRLSGFVGSQMASRSLTPQEGDSTDAILSRAEEALRHDDLDTALQELGSMDEAPLEAISGWTVRAQALSDTLDALNQISAILQPVN